MQNKEELVKDLESKIKVPGLYAQARDYVYLTSRRFQIDLEEIVSGNHMYHVKVAYKRGLKPYGYLTQTDATRKLKAKVKLIVKESLDEDLAASAVCCQAYYCYFIPQRKMETLKFYPRDSYDLTNLNKVLEDAIFQGLETKLTDGRCTMILSEKTFHLQERFNIVMGLSLFGIKK